MDNAPHHLGLALELLRRLETLTSPLLGSPRDTASRHLLLGRLRLVHVLYGNDSSIPDSSTRMDLEGALAALEALPPADTVEVLHHLLPHVPPGPGLVAIARKSLISISESSSAFPPDKSLALALWSSIPIHIRPGETIDPVIFGQALAQAVTSRHPSNALALGDFLDTLDLSHFDPDVHPEFVDLAINRWFEHHVFGHDDAEFDLLDRLSEPSSWLSTLATILARTPLPRPLAESWIPKVEPAWREASTPFECALADARLAAIVGAAGDMPSAEGLLRHALAGLNQEHEPSRRAELYRVIFQAASALPTRQLDAPGLGPWLDAIDKLLLDRVILRSKRAFFLARLAALRTLPRIARVLPEVIDRGQQSLRELCRRVPERTLDLLHLASTAHLQSLAQRSTELQIANLSDTLRRDGLPDAEPELGLDEIVAHIAGVAPEHLGRLSERIQNPVTRALWLETSIGVLGRCP